MKNCLIMGFGRSGTSLMGGLLKDSGYYMGENLYPPRDSNPKGFFENDFINGINERILSRYDYSETYFVKSNEKVYSPYNPNYGQRWLSYINPNETIQKCDDESFLKISEAISKNNFAYKDPRFNYTFKIWDNISSHNIVFICMFRNPEVVADSVMKECMNTDYLSNFIINKSIFYELWYNNYKYILSNLNDELRKRFLFVDYGQFYNQDIYVKISNF